MRNLIVVLLTFLTTQVAAQNPVPVGGGVRDTAVISGSLRVKKQVQLDQFATNDSTQFFGITAAGKLVLRTVTSGGGGSSTTVYTWGAPKLLQAGEVHSTTQYPAFPTYTLYRDTHHGWYKEGVSHTVTGRLVHMTTTTGRANEWMLDTIVAVLKFSGLV